MGIDFVLNATEIALLISIISLLLTSHINLSKRIDDLYRELNKRIDDLFDQMLKKFK